MSRLQTMHFGMAQAAGAVDSPPAEVLVDITGVAEWNRSVEEMTISLFRNLSAFELHPVASASTCYVQRGDPKTKTEPFTATAIFFLKKKKRKKEMTSLLLTRPEVTLLGIPKTVWTPCSQRRNVLDVR